MLSDQRTQRLLNAITSPKTGIVRHIVALPDGSRSFPFHHVQVLPANYDAIPAAGGISVSGGCDTDLERCTTKAALEAVERYCGAFFDAERYLYSKPDQPMLKAGSRHQQFDKQLYDLPDFPFCAIREDRAIHWRIGRSLVDGERRGVPASLVPVPTRVPTPSDNLGPSFSTGMAASWTYESACMSGLLECIERDAFAIAWAHRVSGRRLSTVPGTRLHALVECCLEQAEGIYFTDLHSDLGVPVVCSVLIHHAFGRRFPAVGLSAHPVQAVACFKALSESVSEYERLRAQLSRPEADKRVRGPDDVRDFPDHGELFLHEQFQPAIDFLISDAESVPVEGDLDTRVECSLRSLVGRVSGRAGEVIAVDMTTREIAMLGVRVVKVVVPELVPLHADHRLPYLGHARLRTAGGRQRAEEFNDELVNPIPHPFS